jgi:hypothetical protein
MIKEVLARTVKALTGACEHEPEKQAKVEYLACGECGMELVPLPKDRKLNINDNEDREALIERAGGPRFASPYPEVYCPAAPHHNDEKGGYVLRYVKHSRVICLSCGNEVAPPTTFFRNYIRLNKHVRMRRGTPQDRNGKPLSDIPTFNVGLRFIVPDHPQAVKRVWVTFDEKPASKKFAAMIDREMRFCKNDTEYNNVINRNIDIVRAANPNITEQVVENNGESDES